MKNLKKILSAVLIVALATSMIDGLLFVQAQHTPEFGVTIIVPGNANLLRRQWTQVFASNLQQLGIDAKVVYLGWTSVYDRALTPSAEFVGKTYDQNGYDILALGWTPGLQAEPRQLYYGGDPGFFAPTGQNYYLWNDAKSNDLLDTFITSTSDSEKTDVLKQWQQLYFKEMPASQIMYQQAPVVVNPVIGNLYTPKTGAGEGWLYFNAQPYPQLITRSDGKTSLTYCSTGEIDSLNPPESNSWYDTIVTVPIFNGLAESWPTLNGLSDLETPSLLSSWSHSSDGMTWTFNTRTGVTWHDGEPFTADDVVFSLWALMNGETGSQFTGYFQSVYGDKLTFTYSDGSSVTLGTGNKVGTIKATDANTIQLSLPVLAKGKPFGYFEPYLLSFANNIIPKHIFSNIAPADWATSPFNTGQGSATINGKTYTGPVGTGPYKWVNFDPVGQVVHLERNDNYWNATALKNSGLFQIKDYYIRYIADKTSALAALKNGEVDMLDYNYQMQTDVPSIDASWGKVINLDGVGRQEFGYNMRHPIFGTGVDTPVGKADPSKAAEAARNVRVAFDYAIPRELIINNLLSGYGKAGATPMLPSQAFYDSSITARPYDLAQAKHYLELAGYSPPSIGNAGTVNIQGILNDASGTPRANATVILSSTKDNSTYPDSLTEVAHLATDENGFYSFTIVPEDSGAYYYYLIDTSANPATSTYLGIYSATSTTTTGGLDLTMVAIIVVVILVVVALVVVLMRRKKK
jgi:peptide/nickel transport system substrate-binding protein